MSAAPPSDRDVRFGDGTIEQAGAVAAASGARRVLLVRGRSSFTASGADRLLPGLERAATVEQWADFAPNPDAADLAAGLRIAGDFAPDLVLGVGGGSAMDMAKLLCAFRDAAPQELEDLIRAGRPVVSRSTRLVLAPTTSGSGSEATRFAVVYIGDEKFSVAGRAMLPDTVLLDPSLTLSGTSFQSATSGLDAICQAIESLWARDAGEESRAFARAALGLLLPAIEDFTRAPNPDSARRMALGAHLAGRAIDLSKTTAAHALSYGITKRHGLNHGHAVGITLGAFIEAHAQSGPGALQPGVNAEHHRAVMDEILAMLGAADGADARRRFDALMLRIGLSTGLTAAGAVSGDRDVLASSVNAERLGNNPVQFSSAALVELLEGLD